jgi:hypothetical protein
MSSAPACGSGCLEHRGARSSLQLHHHRPELLELRFVGHLDDRDAATVAQWFERELPRCSAAALFLDFEEFSSYTSATRTMNQRVLLEHRAHWSAIHTLGGSKLVRMGLAVANLALGGAIRVHPTRESFTRDLEHALAQR